MFYNKYRDLDGEGDVMPRVMQGKVTSGSEYLHTKSITILKPLIGNEADPQPEPQPQPQPQPPPAEHNVCCTCTKRKCKQQSCHVIYSKHIHIYRQEMCNKLVYSSRYHSCSNHNSMWGVANCVLATINQVTKQQQHYLVDSSIQCG